MCIVNGLSCDIISGHAQPSFRVMLKLNPFPVLCWKCLLLLCVRSLHLCFIDSPLWGSSLCSPATNWQPLLHRVCIQDSTFFQHGRKKDTQNQPGPSLEIPFFSQNIGGNFQIEIKTQRQIICGSVGFSVVSWQKNRCKPISAHSVGNFWSFMLTLFFLWHIYNTHVCKTKWEVEVKYYLFTEWVGYCSTS